MKQIQNNAKTKCDILKEGPRRPPRSSPATVHNLQPYGRMRPSIMKFATVHL